MKFFLALVLQAAGPDPVEAAVQALFKALTDEQKKICLKASDDAVRDQEMFLGGRRQGLPIKDLKDEPYALLETAIRVFFSEKGYAAALKVAAQGHANPGFKDYTLNFFGDPTRDPTWAFRISEHHLTLVHIHNDPERFGPVLLGANPPEVWAEQEEAAIAFFAKLSPDDRKKCVLEGKKLSGIRLGQDKGCRIAELSPQAREAAARMIEARIRVFSDAQQEKLRGILKGLGGPDTLRIAFFGEMTQRCIDGGRADWKIEGPCFLLDYESHRGHVHMTLRSQPDR